MSGKHHMQTTTCLVLAGSSIVAEGFTSALPIRLGVAEQLSTYFGVTSFTFSTIVWSLILWVCLMFGTLLPDIDSKKSTLGRYVYLPLKHRTWTHTIWCVIPLFLLGIRHPIVGCICLGYVLHLLEDSVSAAGICFLYPLQNYREYPGGAFVAPNHRIKLYHTKGVSERRFVLVICGLCLLIFVKCVFW